MNRALSDTASLISDPGRASMLMTLLSGVSLPAGQLAMIANVTPQTASSHLSRLVAGKLLSVEQQRRHRYYRLMNREVAHAIEALLGVTPDCKQSLANVSKSSCADQDLVFARTCYSHLAGKLAIEIVTALQNRRYLVPCDPSRFEVTVRGRAWFQEFGISVRESQRHPRFARQCLDWTERRHHLAGNLGSALLNRLQELKWIAPITGKRAVRLTIRGQEELQRQLGIRLPQNLQRY